MPDTHRDEVSEVYGEAASGKFLCICGWPAEEGPKPCLGQRKQHSSGGWGPRQGGLQHVGQELAGRVCSEKSVQGRAGLDGAWALMKSKHGSSPPQ